MFLDEIGELSLAAQAGLLRVLQESEVRPVGSTRPRPVDVRLVAATHRELSRMTASGSFRQDLYYRLRVLEVTLPPLRERGSDIAHLAQHLLDKAGHRFGRQHLRLTEAASDAIERHTWPGNVRELENAIERAVILADGDDIEADALGLLPPAADTRPPAPGSTDLSLGEYFRQFVLLHQEGLTETELAKQLGISRKALWMRRQRFELPRPSRTQ